jgi:hypothetical protein
MSKSGVLGVIIAAGVVLGSLVGWWGLLYRNGFQAAILIIGLCCVISGISHHRSLGGTGIRGGASGGAIGGLLVGIVCRICKPGEYELVGYFLFIMAVVGGAFCGLGIGINVWLYLGRPFAREGDFAFLRDRRVWELLRLFSAVMGFTASLLLGSLGRDLP